MSNIDVFDPELKKALTKAGPLSSQPEDIVADAYAKLTPAQKQRFSLIAETLRVEYEDQLDPVQLAFASLAAVLQATALGHFSNVLKGDGIGQMSEEEVLALEFARKLYKENVNDVLKQADSGVRDSNFLKDLDEFMMRRHPDGSFEIKGKSAPKLSLKAVQVIDVEPVKEGPVPERAASPQSPAGSSTDDDLVI